MLGGAELSEGDGVESEHASRLPGHLPPRGAAAELHRAPGRDGLQPGHTGVEETASHRLPRTHTTATGETHARTHATTTFEIWHSGLCSLETPVCDRKVNWNIFIVMTCC